MVQVTVHLPCKAFLTIAHLLSCRNTHNRLNKQRKNSVSAIYFEKVKLIKQGHVMMQKTTDMHYADYTVVHE